MSDLWEIPWTDGRTVEMPESADDWCLYDLPGRDVAAFDLTRALKRVLLAVVRAKLDGEIWKIHGEVDPQLVDMYMGPTMGYHRDVGASDRPVRKLAHRVANDVAGVVIGCVERKV